MAKINLETKVNLMAKINLETKVNVKAKIIVIIKEKKGVISRIISKRRIIEKDEDIDFYIK
jgi:hypothetical protein